MHFKVTAASAILLLVASLSFADAKESEWNLDQVVIVEVLAPESAWIGSPFEVMIRVKNWTKHSVTIGSEDDPPWLEVSLWGEEGLGRTTVGYGEALPVLSIPAGSAQVLKRTVTLRRGHAPGRYVVHGLWSIEDCRTTPLLQITSMIQVGEK